MGQINEKPAKSHQTGVVAKPLGEASLQSEQKAGMTRSASGANLQEHRYGNQFQPIEKLAKVSKIKIKKICAFHSLFVL